MSNLRKIISVALCLILAIGSLCGCGKKYMDAIIYFELLEKPQTVDPQTAQNDSELLIVRNIYEGLMRENADGSVVCGASKSYSYENLTYTFVLDDDAVWSNGERVTAYDFEYAFRRAVDPKIKAPFASRLFSIENAEQIINGSADVSSLGVKALDENTLVITLCKEDGDFLKTLTTSICMPCNEEFFKTTIGKYGLDAKCIISNGSYRLTKWNKEDFGIRIYKNEEYNGKFQAQNAAVFISCVEDETQVSRLADGQSDIAFINGNELDTAASEKLVTKKIQNICWFLTINRNFTNEVRNAFTNALSSDIYSKSLPKGFEVAKSIYPEILNISVDGAELNTYDIDKAKSTMSAQIAKMPDKKFPQSTLYYYEDSGVKELATAIVGHWQQNLSAFINIESSENLPIMQKEIRESTLDFALFPIKAKSGYYEEYVKNFSVIVAGDVSKNLQQELIAKYSVIPVAYQTTNISYIESLENITVQDDNGYIDFSNIIKEK